MLLPLGFDRKDDRKFQEVHIPPSDPPPTHIGKKLVPISELDEVPYVIDLKLCVSVTF